MRAKSPKISNKEFQSLIGALLYVSVNSRPDISAPVSILSQHIKNTREVDWKETQRICKYLKNTADFELKLSFTTPSKPELVGYADASWAEAQEDRKSNSGYLFKLFGGTVSWSSKRQDCTSISSTEAEIVALSETCREALWIRRILTFCDEVQTKATVIFEDNQSCINFHRAGGVSNRTKHIDTRYCFAKDLIAKMIVRIVFCASEHNSADMLTKPIGTIRLRTLRMGIGLMAWSTAAEDRH